MRSITGYLPVGLLALSLATIGVQAVRTEGIQFSHDEQGLCKAYSKTSDGTQVRLKVRNHQWIWVSCSEPEES